MNILWIALAAFCGGLISATLGWCDSGEPFQPRKFLASVLRAVIAGAIFAAGYSYLDEITGIDIIAALCGGAGVDALGNRAAGAIKRLRK